MIVVGIYVLSPADERNQTLYADTTLITADNDLITADRLYGDIASTDIYNRLDLYSDETISVTSAITDANDISKTYTDFSQSFTIPANEKNNEIFSHWYENKIDNGYNAKVRKSAYITLDTKIFRLGKIQLEKVDLKNDIPQSYSITFFGNLVSLKDTFNGAYLTSLDSGTYDFAYTNTVVYNKVTTTNTDVIKFPLITSNRVWNWNSATDVPNQIIGTGSGTTIGVGELFPAIRVKNIFDLISTKFGITFNGSFITTDERFLKAYLWLKNSDTFVARGQALLINSQTNSNYYPMYDYMRFETGSDELILPQVSASYSVVRRKVTIVLTMSASGVSFTLFVFKNGVQMSSFTQNSVVGANSILAMDIVGNTGNITDKYTFKVSSVTPLTFTSTGTLAFTYIFGGSSGSLSATITGTSQTTVNIIPIATYFPYIQLEEFFTGILKMFNLVCYSTTAGVYTIEQLEKYYTQGINLDITKFIQSDARSVERIKPYNKVNFEYEKSSSYTNVNFWGYYGREYGWLAQSFGADGGEYTVKLPFETMLFSNLNGALQVGYSLKNDLKPYIPKPLILYDYGVLQTVTAFKLNGSLPTTYNAFGSETIISSIDYAMNFGAEVSSLTKASVSNTLFSQFYQNYLANLYSSKSRMIKVSAILPVSYLTSSSSTCLNLNTKIIISGKRYIINSFTTNLITGQVDFELINDFRDAV